MGTCSNPCCEVLPCPTGAAGGEHTYVPVPAPRLLTVRCRRPAGECTWPGMAQGQAAATGDLAQDAKSPWQATAEGRCKQAIHPAKKQATWSRWAVARCTQQPAASHSQQPAEVPSASDADYHYDSAAVLLLVGRGSLHGYSGYTGCCYQLKKLIPPLLLVLLMHEMPCAQRTFPC